MPNNCPVHADKGDRGQGTHEDTILDRQFPGLMIGPSWPKVIPPCAPPKVHTASPRMVEKTPPDLHPGTPTLRLDAIPRIGALMLEPASQDRPIVTAHQINPGSSIPPPFQVAILDSKMLNARKLETVVISSWANVLNPQSPQRDVTGLPSTAPTIINIQPVSRGTPNHPILNDYMTGLHQLKS